MPNFFKMPPQLVRLVLLTIAIVCIFFVARYFLVPPSFGQLGHYRGIALQEMAARQPFWAGKASCVAECHTEHGQKLAKAEHKTLSCETCHGPGREHVENPQRQLPKLSFQLCVRCHAASPSRPKWLHQINPANHYTGQLCTECHVPHQPNEVP